MPLQVPTWALLAGYCCELGRRSLAASAQDCPPQCPQHRLARLPAHALRLTLPQILPRLKPPPHRTAQRLLLRALHSLPVRWRCPEPGCLLAAAALRTGPWRHREAPVHSGSTLRLHAAGLLRLVWSQAQRDCLPWQQNPDPWALLPLQQDHALHGIRQSLTASLRSVTRHRQSSAARGCFVHC